MSLPDIPPTVSDIPDMTPTVRRRRLSLPKKPRKDPKAPKGIGLKM